MKNLLLFAAVFMMAFFLNSALGRAVVCKAGNLKEFEIEKLKAGCTIGDKTFFNFKFERPFGFSFFSASDVSVRPLLKGLPGFEFSSTEWFTAQDIQRSSLSYSVAAAKSIINGAELRMVNSAVTGNSLVSISESLTIRERTLFVQDSTARKDFFRRETFNPALVLDVENTIRLVPVGGVAQLATFRNRFSQVGIEAPEPSTLFLLGSGLAGLAWFGRKRLFNKRTSGPALPPASSLKASHVRGR